jgi:predicted DCC family thiol-disulfide oxidoreductase YuxK
MSASPYRLTVLYDGECRFCRLCVALLLKWDRLRRLYPVAITEPEGRCLLISIPESERLRKAHVVTIDGAILSGAEGAPTLFFQLPGGRPLASISAFCMPLTRGIYGFLVAVRPAVSSVLPDAWCTWAANLIAERHRGNTPPTAAR